MKKKVLTWLLLLSTASAMAVPGAYMSVEGGAGNVNGGLFSYSANGWVGRVAAGYLFGGDHFNYGFETGVLAYPDMTGQDSEFLGQQSDYSLKGYNVDLLGVAKYTFDNHFLLLAKAGPSYVHNTSTNNTLNEKTTNDGVRGGVALGVGYQMTPQVAATLTQTETLGTGNLVSTSMVGLTYSFG